MSNCDHKNTYCLCAVEDIKNRALTQARAELEAIRNVIPMNFLQRHDAPGATGPTKSLDLAATVRDVVETGRRVADRAKEAEAKLAAAEENLTQKDRERRWSNDQIQRIASAIGKPDERSDKVVDAALIIINEYFKGATDRLKRFIEAESQAAELRKALEWIVGTECRHKPYMPLGQPVTCQHRVAQEALSNLPASVQARAEREAAVEKVVEAARALLQERGRRRQHESDGDTAVECCAEHYDREDELAIEISTALARLAALDSAQKGEKR